MPTTLNFMPLTGVTRQGEAAFSPESLTGYVGSPYSIAVLRSANKLWQNTGQTIPATSNGHPVARCVCDGINYDAASDAARPILTDDGSNLWALNFDGINHRLTSPPIASLAGARPMTFGLRGKYGTPNPNFNAKTWIMFGSVVDASGRFGSLPTHSVSGKWGYRSPFSDRDSTVYLDQNKHTVTARFTGASGTSLGMWLDNTPLTLDNPTVNALTLSDGTLYLGVGYSGGIICTPCKLYGIAIYNTDLSDGNRLILDNYMTSL